MAHSYVQRTLEKQITVTSEEVGLMCINIAKQRIGPVQHGCGSSLTGIFFGGQVQIAEYGTTECVIMLMQALAGNPFLVLCGHTSCLSAFSPPIVGFPLYVLFLLKRGEVHI